MTANHKDTAEAAASSGSADSDIPVLKLYITGSSPNSLKAIENLKNFCQKNKLNVKYEIIDLYDHPEKTIEQQLIAAPTLVKESPGPIKKLVGDLSDENKILLSLDLKILANIEN